MQDFFIECSVGGTTIVKVTAESLDKALELSAVMVADDFNNAGTLKPYDVQQVVRPFVYTFDKAIEQDDGDDEGYFEVD